MDDSELKYKLKDFPPLFIRVVAKVERSKKMKEKGEIRLSIEEKKEDIEFR